MVLVLDLVQYRPVSATRIISPYLEYQPPVLLETQTARGAPVYDARAHNAANGLLSNPQLVKPELCLAVLSAAPARFGAARGPMPWAGGGW